MRGERSTTIEEDQQWIFKRRRQLADMLENHNLVFETRSMRRDKIWSMREKLDNEVISKRWQLAVLWPLSCSS